MPNRLRLETSPYLLQHQDNPVDWYPWGEEALERAKREDKPILLSIGYSACHWCHVMEHESFENPAIARIMNDHFVCIKVDREERPDLDSVYMGAVQAMTGQGGWPMTVFLTPDGRPFFGGTYFPPEDRYGHVGFPTLLREVARAYREKRADVEHNARQVFQHLQQSLATVAHVNELTPELLDQASERLRRQFDPRHGGFGGAPKFPPAMSLEFLMRSLLRTHDPEERHVVEFTLQAMAAGGLYDHLGGGFHRYSVDAEWRVPHFEKMLYDNALLSRLYVLAFQAFKDERYRAVAEETFDWVAREMRSPEGGFYSTLDADSEGEEGRFYTWTYDDLVSVLGAQSADVFARAYGATPEGNFEDRNVLHLPRALEETATTLGESLGALVTTLALDKARLYRAREHRVRPGRDDKILTAWNGMMLRAFAEAARILDREDYRAIAERAADFLLGSLRRDGKLLRSFKDGSAKLNGYLEDYANLADGLLALYEATFDPRWIREAERLVETMRVEFWDEALGGFYDTGKSHEALIARPQERFDNATPAGNSVACDVLLRLALYLGKNDYRDRVLKVLESLGGVMNKYPNAFGRMLCVLDFALSETKEVAIIGPEGTEETRAMIQAAFASYAPHKVVGATAPGVNPGPVAFLLDRPSLDSKATAYVCVQNTCGLPLTEPRDLTETLEQSP